MEKALIALNKSLLSESLLKDLPSMARGSADEVLCQFWEPSILIWMFSLLLNMWMFPVWDHCHPLFPGWHKCGVPYSDNVHNQLWHYRAAAPAVRAGSLSGSSVSGLLCWRSWIQGVNHGTFSKSWHLFLFSRFGTECLALHPRACQERWIGVCRKQFISLCSQQKELRCYLRPNFYV